MFKLLNLVILTFFVVLLSQSNTQSPYCPISSSGGLIYSQQINVGYGGLVNIVQSQDIQCYNYTLQTQFSVRPGVAVAINTFQCSQTPDIFFSIKPYKTDLSGIIPFIIRTQWKYTQWSKIKFKFFVESRTDLEAGYYQLDTGVLSSCLASKSVTVMIPYQQLQNQTQFSTLKSVVFLHGFEISTSTFNRSPYEIQVKNILTDYTGIKVTLTVTSSTQVHSVFMSYIVYSSYNNQYMDSGLLQLASPIAQPLGYNSQGYNQSPSFLRFHGISGFIITQTQTFGSISFSAVWSQTSFSFNFTYGYTQYQYIGYQYFFLLGSICQQCYGYPYNYNGQCISTCPQGTYPNNNQCISCLQGQFWNGFACISCPNSQIYNPLTKTCQCSLGLFWNGISCINCSNLQIFNSLTKTCQCPQNLFWNGYACINCPSSQIYNPLTKSCQCPQGSYWSYSQCIYCKPNQYWNQTTNKCECPSNQFWNGYNCIYQQQCQYSQTWNPQTSSCQCPLNQFWNGSICQGCYGNQYFDQYSRTCVCQSGLSWNGSSCISCLNGKVYNYQTKKCDCPPGQYQKNGICISCGKDQYFNHYSESCECPQKYMWYNSKCIYVVQCHQSKKFNPNTGACQCSNGLIWGGTNCIQQCQPPRTFNGYQCVCPTNTIWNGYNCININNPNCTNGYIWNGFQCIPVSQCSPGTIWNGYKCQPNGDICPLNTFWNGSACVNIIYNCPQGCQWRNNRCQTTRPDCPQGTYWDGFKCAWISQNCLYGSVWNGTDCVSNCTNGKYWNQLTCVDIQCPNGQNYNPNTKRCQCSYGQLWNGILCSSCTGDRIWSFSSCICPPGKFWNGNLCIDINNNQCNSIPNSIFTNSQCSCKSGYDQQYISQNSFSCVCKGLQTQGFCDRCYWLPFSQYINGQCQCIYGYVLNGNGYCQKSGSNPGNGNGSCNVANYFNSNEKKCVRCSQGCLSCSGSYECIQCSIDFNYNYLTKLCTQKCGDGKRYFVECDDGNNYNGDGCSCDCKIQPGYFCKGGSPNSPDTCTRQTPNKLTITQTGQIHSFGQITVNIKLNYLSQDLIDKICSERQCKGVLKIVITQGFGGVTTIENSYIKGTSFTFKVDFNFGRQPIGSFVAEASIDPQFASYFQNIDISQKTKFAVDPSYLALVGGQDILDALVLKSVSQNEDLIS